MIKIYTGTERRTELADLWSTAIHRTLKDPHTTIICYQINEPFGGDTRIKVPRIGGHGIHTWVRDNIMFKDMKKIYIEEDIIPVRLWSMDDYPGDLLYMDGASDVIKAHPDMSDKLKNGMPWPGMMISRTFSVPSDTRIKLIPQHFVRDHGCPDWLPKEFWEPALEANSSVVGEHFLHIDKSYREELPTFPAKQKLIKLLQDYYS